MVRLTFFAVASLSLTVWAAPQQKLRLSPKDIAELVLKQGPATEQVNDKYLVTRFAPIEILHKYDWTTTLESGYDFDKSESLERGAFSGTAVKKLRTVLSLNKSFSTGTKFDLHYWQTAINADNNLGASNENQPQLNRASQGEFGLGFEQSLLNNAFGIGDRATIRSAKKTFEAEGIKRVNDLENVVLGALTQFWNCYVAEETFRESLASRERFKSLVGQVRRKSNVGYANPGELAQAEADFESIEQRVKKESTTYLAQLDGLLTNLNLPPGTEIEFLVSDNVPPVPKLPQRSVEELRAMRTGQLQLEAAKDALLAAQTRRYPEVNLVGRYATTGFDETGDGSFSRLSANGHPKYYVGAKLSYGFGSDYQSEDIINKRAQRSLTETALALERQNAANALLQDERSVESTYAILQSAFRQKDFRERAVRELTKTYGQGRTDIKVLIDAINNQFDTKVQLSRALGDYQIALNKWAASRDELISNSDDDSSQQKEKDSWKQ